MFVTTHTAAGAVVGASRRLLPAFAAGVFSHLALDAVPHWGCQDPNRFLRVARVDGTAGLAVMGLLAAAAPADRRRAVVAGMVGGVLLDMDKPFKELTGRQLWPSWLHRVHVRVQREHPRHLRRELAFGALTIATATRLLLGHRRAVFVT